MIGQEFLLWWDGLEAETGLFWHRKLLEKEIPAEFQVIHRGFDAITGLGPSPTLYRVVILKAHVDIAMLAMSPLMVWPEAEDTIYQLSPIGLWAWKEGWIPTDGVTRTLAHVLWRRMYGGQRVFAQGK